MPRTKKADKFHPAVEQVIEESKNVSAEPEETEEKSVAIEVPKLEPRIAHITLVGDSPLITHAWSEKAKKQMLDKQMKKGKAGGKEAKDPEKDYYDSLYHLEGGKYGFPVVAFKAAAVRAAGQMDGVKMTNARAAFHIVGEYAEIDGTPEPREDMVRVGMGTADIRYRGMFREWRTTLTIRYNENVLSLEQIISLFNLAGFGVGVGEWRPQRNGSYGMFHVATEGEV